jgi:hypothetical protein
MYVVSTCMDSVHDLCCVLMCNAVKGRNHDSSDITTHVWRMLSDVRYVRANNVRTCSLCMFVLHTKKKKSK